MAQKEKERGGGGGKIVHFLSSQEGVFSLIVNLTRALEGVSFAGEEKEVSLSIDWATTSGRHVTSNYPTSTCLTFLR